MEGVSLLGPPRHRRRLASASQWPGSGPRGNGAPSGIMHHNLSGASIDPHLEGGVRPLRLTFTRGHVLMRSCVFHLFAACIVCLSYSCNYLTLLYSIITISVYDCIYFRPVLPVLSTHPLPRRHTNVFGGPTASR